MENSCGWRPETKHRTTDNAGVARRRSRVSVMAQPRADGILSKLWREVENQATLEEADPTAYTSGTCPNKSHGAPLDQKTLSIDPSAQVLEMLLRSFVRL